MQWSTASGSNLWQQGDPPMLMGIMNITPDSFSDGGQFNSIESAKKRADILLQQGADILDIGAESSRPGANYVTEEEEWSRLQPILNSLKDVNIPISIDTRRSSIFKKSHDYGALIWNDISAGDNDHLVWETLKQTGALYIAMHKKGESISMQQNPQYGNVVLEIKQYLQNKLNQAIGLGVNESQIALDYGIGFGKTLDDNLNLIKNTSTFNSLKHPIVFGASRKRFIDDLYPSPVDQRIGGSIAAALWAAEQGAAVLRVHDVDQTKQALLTWQAIQNHK